MIDEKNSHPRSAWAGAVWTIAGFGSLQVLRLGFNIVLARLLLPEVFGVMALVNVLNQGLQMLSDAGVWLCVLRSKRGDEPVFLQTAWTFLVIRGLILWGAAVAIAWPAAWIYQDAQLGPLLATAGFTSVIGAFRSMSWLTQNRKLAVGKLVLMEIGSYSISMLVAVAWIWHTPSAWALVAAALIATCMQTAFSYCWLPPSPAGHRFRWESSAVRELMLFGRWIFISTIFTFLASHADRLLMGWIVSVSTLGIYHIAAMFAVMPVFLVTCLTNQVLLPYYSRLAEQGNQARIPQVHFLASLFAWGMTAGTQLLGPTVIGLLYRGPYEQAGWMLQILSVGAWFACLHAIGTTKLLAEGRSQSMAVINLMKLACLLVFLPAASDYGICGVLWVFVIGDLIRYLSTLWAMGRYGLGTAAREFGLTIALLLTTAFCDACITTTLPLARSILQVGVVAGVLACFAGLWLWKSRSSNSPETATAWSTSLSASGVR